MTLSKDDIIRNEIIKQAQKLFQQFGLKKTTMDEIAEACNKAKSTLYYYFKSKEEVFVAVVDFEIRSLRQLVKNQVDKGTNVQEKVINYLICFHRNISEKINLYRVAKHEIKYNIISVDIFANFIDFEKKYLLRILEDAMDAGELKSLAKNELDWMAEIMLVAFFGIVRYSIEKDEIMDIEKLEKSAKMIVPKLFY